MSIQGFPGCLRDNHALNKIILVLLKGERISRACSDDNDAWFFFFKRLFRGIIENKITQVRNQLIKNLNIFLLDCWTIQSASSSRISLPADCI